MFADNFCKEKSSVECVAINKFQLRKKKFLRFSGKVFEHTLTAQLGKERYQR